MSMNIYIAEIQKLIFLRREYTKQTSENDKENLMHDICQTLMNVYSKTINNPLTLDEKMNLYNINKLHLYQIAQILRKYPRKNTQFLHNNVRVPNLVELVMEPSFMYVTFTKQLLDYIATVFKEFMKGITFYQTNTGVDRPIYHRDQSCGDRGSLHELDCTYIYDDPDEYRKRSQKVRNCYIERLVYDEIFKAYFPSQEQNFQHRAMGLNTGRGIDKFASCFPSTVLEVEIEWSADRLFPVQLVIYTTSPGKSKMEIYARSMNAYDPLEHNVNIIQNLKINVIPSLYQPIVDCSRWILDQETKTYVHNNKVQSYDSVTSWNEVNVDVLHGGAKLQKKSKQLHIKRFHKE